MVVKKHSSREEFYQSGTQGKRLIITSQGLRFIEQELSNILGCCLNFTSCEGWEKTKTTVVTETPRLDYQLLFRKGET